MIDIEYDYDFIWKADMPRKEKHKAVNEVVALVVEYQSWEPYKKHGGVEARKRLIRKAKNRQKKKIDALRETLHYLLHPDVYTLEEEGTDRTVVELGHILGKWESMDMVKTVDDYFDGKMPKKPNTKAIVSKLEELHNKYNIQNKTYNIRIFLEQL